MSFRIAVTGTPTAIAAFLEGDNATYVPQSLKDAINFVAGNQPPNTVVKVETYGHIGGGGPYDPSNIGKLEISAIQLLPEPPAAPIEAPAPPVTEPDTAPEVQPQPPAVTDGTTAVDPTAT